MSADDVLVRAREALDGITEGDWGSEATGMYPVSDDEFGIASGDYYVAEYVTKKSDADFIAAAPQLVADLADEVEKLRAGEADAMRGLIANRDAAIHMTKLHHRAMRERRDAEAERDRLRATIARVRELAEDTGKFQARAKHLHCGSARLLGMEVLRALDGEAQG